MINVILKKNVRSKKHFLFGAIYHRHPLRVHCPETEIFMSRKRNSDSSVSMLWRKRFGSRFILRTLKFSQNRGQFEQFCCLRFVYQQFDNFRLPH